MSGRPPGDPHVRIVGLSSQVPAGVLAAGREPLRLTWRVAPAVADLVQEAYEIEASTTPDFVAAIATAGVVESDEQVGVPAPGDPLASREVRFLRVRVRAGGRWTPWGPLLRAEAGLLEPGDWVARAISLPDHPGKPGPAPSPLLRRVFDLPASVASARLYVTSLGVHRMSVNGRPVSDDLLAPGWTPYRQRLIADAYDVTSLLVAGPNVIAGVLGDGWWRGRIGLGEDQEERRSVGLLAQLEIRLPDGSLQVVATDGTWRAATGEILAADLYDGTDIDLRQRRDGWELPGYDDRDWAAAAEVPLDLAAIEPRIAPPVRPVATLPVERSRRPDGTTLLDAGQNIAGFVRLTVRGVRGQQVTVRHAEVLEPDGSLHVRSLRSARATDTYILADEGEVTLEPPFTFHGFRYATVETEAEVVDATFVAISSDTPRRGWFDCSDERLRRFHDNVLWSQRDNFVSLPTDCPQRDERLGWTGDAAAFAPTACTLFDSEAFWASWLRDLELEQDDVAGVPSVVPRPGWSGEMAMGRAGWADAATMVPWAVYESTGDLAILRRQLDSMRRWVASLEARLGPDDLLPESPQFGDWLDPDAPAGRPWEAKADSTFLANAFLAHSARLLADAEVVLGLVAEAGGHRALADRVADATWARWAAHARSTQTGCAIALRFGLVPGGERADVAGALAELVTAADGRVATGFLGTPQVLPALGEAGHHDEAYRMLLRREVRSWLYQVDKGATTVWERWDAIRPDGSVHDGLLRSPEDGSGEFNMLSFNHYAYGAVLDWVYRNVAGITLDPARPGYRHTVFAPVPVIGIEWARARVVSGYGAVSIDWRLDEAGLTATVDLPFGTSGRFVAPATPGSSVKVDGHPSGPQVLLGPGTHAIVVTNPRICHSG